MTVSKQIKYAFRLGAYWRYSVFGLVMLINIVFGGINNFGTLPNAALVTGISLSGVGIGAVTIANLAVTIATLQSVFGKFGYAYALAPVSRTKILFTRVVVCFVQDIIMLAASILGLLWIIFPGYGISSIPNEAVFGFIFGTVQFAVLYMFIAFNCVVEKSVLFAKKLKIGLSILCFAVFAWLFTTVDIVLSPFAIVHQAGLFFNLLLYDYRGLAAFSALAAVKIVVLFFMSRRLLEKEMNYS